jgi:hypothetical protein
VQDVPRRKPKRSHRLRTTSVRAACLRDEVTRKGLAGPGSLVNEPAARLSGGVVPLDCYFK